MEKYKYPDDFINKVICGDCLEVLKQIPDKSINLVLTDPPYGHNNNDKGDLISRRDVALGRSDYIPERDNRPIINDGVEANEIFEKFIQETARILTDDGVCCCCCSGGGGPNPTFAKRALIMDKYLSFKQMIIWDKGPIGIGWQYRRSYEIILVASKKDKMAWYDNSKKIENIIRPGYKGIKKIIPSKDHHPTQKPVELMKHFIELHTKENDIVLDPFLGSGTTAVACIELNRRFIGIEISPEYCKMAEERIKNFDSGINQKRLGLT